MKNLNNMKISLGKLVPRLDSTSDAPVKLIFVILYIVGAVLVWNTQTNIAAVTENIQFISPLAVFTARNLLTVYLIFAGIALAILILMPLGKRFVEEQMRSIGLVNHADEVPVLKKKFKDKKFAAGCSRDVIKEGAERLGWTLEELMEKTILAMRSCEAAVGAEMETL